MKRLGLVLLGAALLLILAVPHATTFAAADAHCSSNPPVGAIGTVFQITCTGFDPNTGVFAYLVEPTGTALGPAAWGGGAGKTDGGGRVSYTITSNYFNVVTMAYGTWHIAVEQLGLAKSVVHRGETSWRITGGADGVDDKAVLSTSPYIVHKYLDSQTLHGTGFTPFEPVTIWMEFAKGQCATVTEHLSSGNVVDLGGISVLGLGDVRADAAGAFTTEFPPSGGDNCEGTYHFVARGNLSHHGASVAFILTGNAIHPTIVLNAFPRVQSAAPGNRVSFSGTGFWSGEVVSCWLTESRGHTVSVPDVKASASGSIALAITTGSVDSISIIGLAISNSEGPLGEWNLTCRGNASKLQGLATFRLIGGIVDP